MTYRITYFKVPLFIGGGYWITRDVEAESCEIAKRIASRFWGFRNIKSVEWVR